MFLISIETLATEAFFLCNINYLLVESEIFLLRLNVWD